MTSQLAQQRDGIGQITLAALVRDSVETFILMPPRVIYWGAYQRQWPRFNMASVWKSLRFLFARNLSLKLFQRVALVERFVRISQRVDCAHTVEELLDVSIAILRLPRSAPGVIVEAGAFRGGSAAKISLAAQLAGRKLFVFELFRRHSG